MFDKWPPIFVFLAFFGDIAIFSLCFKLVKDDDGADEGASDRHDSLNKVSQIWSKVAKFCLLLLVILHAILFFIIYPYRNDLGYIANELFSSEPAISVLAGSFLSIVEFFIGFLGIWPFSKKASKRFISSKRAVFVSILMTIALLLPFGILVFGGIKMYSENNWETPVKAIERLEAEAIQCWEAIGSEFSADEIKNAAMNTASLLEEAESIAEKYLFDENRTAKLKEINETRIETYYYEDAVWMMWIQFSDMKRDSSEIKSVLARNETLMQELKAASKSEYEDWAIELAEADFRRVVAMSEIAEDLPSAQSVNVLNMYHKIEREATDTGIRKEAAINGATFSFHVFEKGVVYESRRLVSDAEELLNEMEKSERELPELSEDVSWVNLKTHLRSMVESE